MPTAKQYQTIDVHGNPAAPLDYRTWARGTGYAGQQVQQLQVQNPCAQAWADIFTMDIRFVGTLVVDHLTQRALVTCHSASGEPSIVIPGAEVHVIESWDSPTPANFGGDGHQWWKVAYIIPDSGDEVDFSSVTGSLRFATWFTCEGTLPTTDGLGNFGDGVAIIYDQHLEYTLTFGSATASVSVSQAALPKDALFLWVDTEARSIDEVFNEKFFHAANEALFDNDYETNGDFVPSEPGGGPSSSFDWTTDNRAANDPVMSYTMGCRITATADIFPGSCRVVATAFGADLRALCPL